MPTHSEQRIVPYAPDDIFALVADIEKYPEFLPWTAACRIRDRQPLDPGADGEPRAGEVLTADLVISFRVFRERFGSRVTLRPDERIIDVAYIDGPFKYLENRWRILPEPGGQTTIDFYVDFEFRNRTLQALIGLVFGEAVRRVVGAFEKRAAALYQPVA